MQKITAHTSTLDDADIDPFELIDGDNPDYFSMDPWSGPSDMHEFFEEIHENPNDNNIHNICSNNCNTIVSNNSPLNCHLDSKEVDFSASNSQSGGSSTATNRTEWSNLRKGKGYIYIYAFLIHQRGLLVARVLTHLSSQFCFIPFEALARHFLPWRLQAGARSHRALSLLRVPLCPSSCRPSAMAAACDGKANFSKRPDRSARARREQYARAHARVAQTLVKGLMALNHRGCRRSKIGDALLRLLSEDGESEDSLPATASQPWQWQWPQAEESLLQPTCQWQHVYQPDAFWHSIHSPLGPACSAEVSSAACGKATAAEEARAASAAPPAVDVHRTALLKPVSKVPEQSPGAQSDGSSSTTCAHHKRDRHSSRSQSLDNTEEAPVEVALAQQPGQDLSAKSQTAKVLSATQKPLASTHTPGVGESSQASLESQASDTPSLELDDPVAREVKLLERHRQVSAAVHYLETLLAELGSQRHKPTHSAALRELYEKHFQQATKQLVDKKEELKAVSDEQLLLAGPLADQPPAG